MVREITRRKFLAESAKPIIAASVAGHLLGCNGQRVKTARPEDAGKLCDYLNHFKIDKQDIRRTISEALSCGGDYCDVYFQHKISNAIAVEDKAVRQANCGIDFGVGVRVIKGERTGYSFSEQVTPEALKRAAMTAARIAQAEAGSEPVEFSPAAKKNFYPIEQSWEDVGVDKKVVFVKNLDEKIYRLDKRIIKSWIRLADETSYVLIANSDGRIAYDYRPRCTLLVKCTAEQDGRREENYSYIAGRYGFEFCSAGRAERAAKEAVEKTVALLEAIKPAGGEMEVVLAAGTSGILLHEAIGHGLEADFNRKKMSLFAEKMGKSVADKMVTIVDDGTLSNEHGSLNIDDEGTEGQKTCLVENGVVRSYMQDVLSARYYKTSPTGNGRRESFRHAPIPRMRNTYMPAGPHKKQEIIKSVKKGLYAEMFTNGQVNIGSGDFSFYVKSGRLIENGKLGSYVKDINIIGNGPEVLSNIVMVGDDLQIHEGGGMCGKGGQMVPISFGLPTVKVSKITVGGVS